MPSNIYNPSPLPVVTGARLPPRKANEVTLSSIAIADTMSFLNETGLDTVVYVSMAFGNPYNDVWDVDELMEGVSLLADLDVQAISLADTVGLATPELIASVVGRCLAKFDGVEMGVHLHSRPDHAAAKVLAAYDAGCRRFDSAIGGLGGCPFAQDVLVGNIPTETLLQALQSRGVTLPVAKPVGDLVRMSADIASRFSGPTM